MLRYACCITIIPCALYVRFRRIISCALEYEKTCGLRFRNTPSHKNDDGTVVNGNEDADDPMCVEGVTLRMRVKICQPLSQRGVD